MGCREVIGGGVMDGKEWRDGERRREAGRNNEIQIEWSCRKKYRVVERMKSENKRKYRGIQNEFNLPQKD